MKPEPIEGDKASSTVAFLLSQVGLYAARRFHELIGALDIHPGWFRVLNVVDAAEGRSQHAIGEAIQVPPSRMVAIVDELERRGLVERRPDPADRRVRALHLTANGRKLLERGRKIAHEHEQNVTRGLTAAERKQLISLLNKVAEGQGLGPGVHPGLSEPEPGKVE